MKYRAILVLITSLILGSSIPLAAQSVRVTSDSLSTAVHFRQGYSLLELNLFDNEQHLQSFIDACLSAPERGAKVGHVHITASASPEGSTQLNERLAKNRAQHIVDYLKPRLEGFVFDIEPRSVDYEYLAELVEQSDMPWKEKTLDVLRNTPIWVIKNGKVVDSKKRQLENIAGGQAWWYMYEHFFPAMRNAGAGLTCTFEEVIPAPEPEPVPEPEPEPIPEPVPEPIVEPEPEPEPVIVPTKKPWYLAVRTNMLFDAALIPNIGVEVYLGRNWSLAGMWNYSWWKNDNVHWYEQTYGGYFEARRYFGPQADLKPHSGHHLSAYFQMMTYDMETGNRGYQAPHKWTYGGGVNYGYTIPIGKRLNLDFALGVGYLGGKYYEYIPIDNCYVWQATKLRRYFGPTTAEISLVWLIGRGNVNPGYPKRSSSQELMLSDLPLDNTTKHDGDESHE